MAEKPKVRKAGVVVGTAASLIAAGARVGHSVNKPTKATGYHHVGGGGRRR